MRILLEEMSWNGGSAGGSVSEWGFCWLKCLGMGVLLVEMSCNWGSAGRNLLLVWNSRSSPI